MNLAVYISGHGFGHLAQLAPVLKRIHQIKPECRFFIRCALPEHEIRAQMPMAFKLNNKPVDVGVVQLNAVQEDCETSIQQMSAWIDHFDDHINQEIEWLKSIQATRVLSNISPLAFPAAKALGIPSIGLASLDWHTIYKHWLDAYDPIILTLAQAYGASDLLISPPMAMDMPVFPSQQYVALIVSQPNKNTILPPAIKHDGRKKALILFGGCGSPPYDVHALAAMPDWLFLIPDICSDHISPMPENIVSIHFSSKLRPIDVMASMIDVVLCKPGYGVLSECWTTATPIAWVERPDFPEFPMLKTWLDESFPACGMSRSDFQAGHWQPALEHALNHPRRFPAIKGDGANIAADIILHYPLHK
ncbi:hypothetical protein JYT48_00185 [Mariprofundus ferrooxydans]|nr:hypothetical protein [Mariprofundus ferrooxydans]